MFPKVGVNTVAAVPLVPLAWQVLRWAAGAYIANAVRIEFYGTVAAAGAGVVAQSACWRGDPQACTTAQEIAFGYHLSLSLAPGGPGWRFRRPAPNAPTLPEVVIARPILSVADDAATVAPRVSAGAGLTDDAVDLIATEGGSVIEVPRGAMGQSPVNTGRGSQFTGGSGGGGLHPNVSNVHVMDPTPPRGPSTGYPNGDVNDSNAAGQTVNPYVGQTIGKADPWWDMQLDGR
jgi:hypothetical protein